MFNIENVKSKVENILFDIECFIDDTLRRIRMIPRVLRANIDLLYNFNRYGWYNDWDYEFLYEMIVWKLNKIRNCIKENDIIVESDKVYNEITEALNQWDIYRDPESAMKKPKWMEERLEKAITNGDYIGFSRDNLTEEQLNEEKDYYTNYYKTEQKAWNKFHDILKKKAQGWWD